MDVKAAPSFRPQVPEQTSMRSYADNGSDFSAKLGLRRDPDVTLHQEVQASREEVMHQALQTTQTVDRQMASQRLTVVAAANEQVVRSQGMQGEVRPDALMELYALSLRAGHHLSHVPHAFLADIQALQAVGMGGGVTASDAINVPSNTLAQMVGPALVSDGMSPTAEQGRALGHDLEPSLVAREWARYLGTKWPERRWQLLTRSDGLELLVRDYHLTHEEQDALLTDLLAHMPSSSQAPERIWLNGQLAWQSESSLHHSVTGGHHGR